MSLQRRAGAPRLIDWTGERCVPWTPDVQVVYEHLHRYLWAAEIISGRRVLDVGSGEGFGASILSDRASEVVGVDIDERTIEHAQMNWSSASVAFAQADATDLSRFADGSFGAVVAFEVIEHLEHQEKMLAEIKRVLSDDGLLIVSTPDRRTYSESAGQENPFHVRELTLEEFVALLGHSFDHVATWGQRTITGSHLGVLPGAQGSHPRSHEDFFIERAGEEWRIAGQPSGLYLVAVASRQALPEVSTQSTLGDCDLELVRSAEKRWAERVDELEAGLISARDARDADDEHHRQRESELRARDATELRARDATIAKREIELRERDVHVRHLGEEVASLRSRLRDAQDHGVRLGEQIAQAATETQRMRESVTWRLSQRIRGRIFATVGEHSAPVRVVKCLLRLGGRLLDHGGQEAVAGPGAEDERPKGEPIVFPAFERPTVSLVVPLFAQAGLTRRCLETIRDNTDQGSYEVILVDDCADGDTKALLEVVEGARVIINRENIGYLRSVRRGAGAALGEWLVLCNNDIEVATGWLKALLLTGESDASVGIVTPKYTSPDGKLSEAGGILWRDATGVNFGRGDDAGRFEYEFTREVDYGSAAALMVRAELWREVGGYDELFVPMYYEDADLCMQARQRGWRVLYEPSAVVLHREGATAGTDIQSGYKRHQEVNRHKFLSKWELVLEADHLPPDPRQIRRAANRLRGPRVLVVDFRVPMWDRDAGSLRMLEIISSLMRTGFSVTFLPDNLAPLEPYTRALQRLGVEVIFGGDDLSGELAEIGPGLVAAILSRPHSASRWLDSLREHAPAAMMVYDTVDLHWVRESRRFALGRTGTAEGGAARAEGPKAAALLELELAMVRATDRTITVTQEEQEVVQTLVPGAKVTIIPTIHDITQPVAPPEGREGLLFVGGFEHPPNVDAVEYLVREVMPLVWERASEAKLTIVGSRPPAAVHGLASARVNVRGWVEDLGPLLQASRALVVPVRFGAGVKGKITQGLAAGLPVVTTAIGTEGLRATDYENVLVGDTAQALTERIVQVLVDDSLWRALSVAGQDLVARTCSLAVLDERLAELLEGVRDKGVVPASASSLPRTL